MFTGIIEEVGTVRSFTRSGDVYRLTIECGFAHEVKKGDSISVNGACLTVVERNDGSFTVEVVEETFKRTNLRHLVPGDRVNLERALETSSRINGHFVTGHVDGVGEVTGIVRKERSAEFYIRLPEELKWFVAEKGSIAVDGISLTVASVEGSTVKVAVVPFTLEHTNLKFKKVSSKVNIEVDIIARYVLRALEKQDYRETLESFLKRGA